MDTCNHMGEVVGRNTVADPEGVMEYFFPPVVLKRHPCHFAGPEVVSDPASACPGSEISSLSACRANPVDFLSDFT